jgi:hypothetical protein
VPTDADLQARAKTLVERMVEVGRIVYAIPATIDRGKVEAAIRNAGLHLREVAAPPVLDAKEWHEDVTRWTDESGDDELVLLERPDLGVHIFETRGPRAFDRARAVLDRVPFVPQSKLLREAIDVASPDAPKALLVLAHQCVAWDDDWSDLFLLHLASPDPLARHNAVSCTFLAAMISGARAAAIDLLREASRREKFPKLRETIDDAIDRLS